jgi:hypothetical protein
MNLQDLYIHGREKENMAGRRGLEGFCQTVTSSKYSASRVQVYYSWKIQGMLSHIVNKITMALGFLDITEHVPFLRLWESEPWCP